MPGLQPVTVRSTVPLSFGRTSDQARPRLHAIQVKQISSELLAGIIFTANMVVTLSRASTVKVFTRPEQRF